VRETRNLAHAIRTIPTPLHRCEQHQVGPTPAARGPESRAFADPSVIETAAAGDAASLHLLQSSIGI
jgi:hypothetical protein